MIFKSSYIVTENNALLRCGPVVGRRQIIALGFAAAASLAAGVVAFSVLTSSLPGRSRVSWTLHPPKTAQTLPGRPTIVLTTARTVPSVAAQTADQSKGLPRS